MTQTVRCDNSLCGKVHYEEAPSYMTLTRGYQTFGEPSEWHFCDEICIQLFMQVRAPISGRDLNEPDLETLTRVVASRIGAETPWAKTHIHDILVTAWSILRTKVHWDVENARAEAYKLGFKVAVEMHQCDGEGSWCNLCEKVEREKPPPSENEGGF